jgi:hypothetical protein
MDNLPSSEIVNEVRREELCATMDKSPPSDATTEIRTSERLRKVPITRSSDFFYGR